MTRTGLSVLALFFSMPLSSPASSGTEPDPSAWQRLLARYLDTAAADGIRRFRYGAVTPADKASLDAYLASMQAAKVSGLSAEAQRAFWINLYNAGTVDAVLGAYPLESVRDIRVPGSASPGPWDARRFKVEGRELSLDDIENGILRARWKDNRVHFALNCASLGCPDLSARAFTAANLDTLLEQGARAYLRSPRGASFTGDNLTLSSIFAWYRDDFGKTDRELLETLSRYAPADKGKRLREYSGKIAYRYDWRLNGT